MGNEQIKEEVGEVFSLPDFQIDVKNVTLTPFSELQKPMPYKRQGVRRCVDSLPDLRSKYPFSWFLDYSFEKFLIAWKTHSDKFLM